MSHQILVVDDEPDITALVAHHLTREGYRVLTAANGPDALRAARAHPPDLVVLDLMLPGMSGLDVMAALRAAPESRAAGVLLLTARRDESDRIEGFTRGADDYLTKPFSPRELTLRVAALLRRLESSVSGNRTVLEIGPITVDTVAHRVSVGGEPVDLTATEYRLLVTLAEGQGRTQSRRQLLQAVWNASPDIQTRTVDMHVQRLRSKLGEAGSLIETVRGFGYGILTGEDGAT